MLFMRNTKKERRSPVGSFLRSEAGKFFVSFLVFDLSAAQHPSMLLCKWPQKVVLANTSFCSKGREEPKQRIQNRRLCLVPSALVLPPKPPLCGQRPLSWWPGKKWSRMELPKPHPLCACFWRPSLSSILFWWWCSGWMFSLLCCVCVSWGWASLFVVTKFKWNN